MLGETPLELHRRLRLERAAWTLVRERTSVTTIAFMAGYETHESFTRAFRAHYGCSPSEFRDRARDDGEACARPAQVELPARSGIHFDLDRARIPMIPLIHAEGKMDIEIRDMPELRVATVAHIGPYNRISEAFARLGGTAGQSGLFGPDAAMLALYHDDPETTPVAELRSDAAIVISRDARVPDTLGERRIDGGRYACATHVGPYEQLGDAWAQLMGEWLPHSGERMRDGVAFEIYRNTPADTPPQELRTELYIPLM
jgi:AraC family transcriptional regulator